MEDPEAVQFEIVHRDTHRGGKSTTSPLPASDSEIPYTMKIPE